MFKFCPYCGYKIEEQQKSGFQCPQCKKWTHYASAPTASVIIKVGSEALLVVRGIEPGKGQLDIAGGFLENGEDPIMGAVRELKEEVGLEIDTDQLKFLGIWIDTYHYQNQDQFTINVAYLLEVEKKFAGKPADDVAELVWVPLSESPKFAFPWVSKVWKKIRSS